MKVRVNVNVMNLLLLRVLVVFIINRVYGVEWLEVFLEMLMLGLLVPFLHVRLAPLINPDSKNITILKLFFY